MSLGSQIDDAYTYFSRESYSPSSDFSSTSCWSEDCDWKEFNFESEKRQRIINSKWGGYSLHISLWKDSNAPVVKIKQASEIEFNSLEYCGILSDRIVGACSSFLTRSPENQLYVMSKCELIKMNLVDISILYYHRYLQYVDLAYNNLIDLTPLGGIPYLMYLNVSYNKLKDVLRFSPPWYLTYVNLSHNRITEIDDLNDFWSIVRLDLSHNAIECISGLQNLKHLKYLNLAYNLIECVENLDGLNIQELNLEYNCITEFKSVNPEFGINTLPNLRTIILAHNKLSSLEFFKDAYGLRLVDLKYNKIIDLLEVSYLKSLVYEVDFRGNPCTKWPSYKHVLLFSMPSVVYVDGTEVAVTEKVSAATLFAPSIDLIAAQSLTKLILLEHLNLPKIDTITPCDQANLPLIILSGPPAIKKGALALKIANALSNRVRYCRSHTTREFPENEEDAASYYFVKREEFNEIARHGEFLSIEELLGNRYGFHISEIAAIALEAKIGITHMDLHAALQMRHRYRNTKIILVLTKDEEAHREWIREKIQVFTWIKDSVENLLSVDISKRVDVDSLESTSSRTDFVSEIVNEVIENLDLPTYSSNVRPQGTGATTTDIILESKVMLPKVTKMRNQVEIEGRKRITFKEEGNDEHKINIDPRQISQDQSSKHVELKIILDEKSNIIIDDKESKSKRHRARISFCRNVLEIRDYDILNDAEFEESLSSEESDVKLPCKQSVKPERLADMYIEHVLASRQMYVNYHLTNPGLFSLVLLSDEFHDAFNSLIDFIYELYINFPFRKSEYHQETEGLKQTMVPEKIKPIINELRENLSTSKIQQKMLLKARDTASWKQPKINK